MIEFLLFLCSSVPEVWRDSLQLMLCHVAPNLFSVCACVCLNAADNVLCPKEGFVWY